MFIPLSLPRFGLLKRLSMYCITTDYVLSFAVLSGLGAAAAGWDTVYFNPNGTPHNEQPTFEVRSLDELLAIL